MSLKSQFCLLLYKNCSFFNSPKKFKNRKIFRALLIESLTLQANFALKSRLFLNFFIFFLKKLNFPKKAKKLYFFWKITRKVAEFRKCLNIYGNLGRNQRNTAGPHRFYPVLWRFLEGWKPRRRTRKTLLKNCDF